MQMARSAPHRVHLTSAGLSATIDPLGAQLMSLRTAEGTELLWQGDPAWWPDRAPILFPVIGPLRDGVLRHKGRTYPMPAHGFARLRQFDVTMETDGQCVFELKSDETTRQHYPFAFLLRVGFELSEEGLVVTATVQNQENELLPVDVGFHPGFNWPFMLGDERDDYVIAFRANELAPIRRGVDDPIFLTPGARPTPVEGNVLRIRDELFSENAIVFDQLSSRSLTFGKKGSLNLRIAFPDSPYLAVWTRPGAPFLCIEPWQGLPSPVDFRGEIADKPGIALIPPGQTLPWRLLVTPTHAQETSP